MYRKFLTLAAGAVALTAASLSTSPAMAAGKLALFLPCRRPAGVSKSVCRPRAPTLRARRRPPPRDKPLDAPGERARPRFVEHLHPQRKQQRALRRQLRRQLPPHRLAHRATKWARPSASISLHRKVLPMPTQRGKR